MPPPAINFAFAFILPMLSIHVKYAFSNHLRPSLRSGFLQQPVISYLLLFIFNAWTS